MFTQLTPTNIRRFLILAEFLIKGTSFSPAADDKYLHDDTKS
jgi:hypothetical protein